MKSFILLSAVLASVLVMYVEANPTTVKAKAKEFSCYTCPDCPDPGNGTIVLPDSMKQKCPAGIEQCFKYFHTDKKVQRGCSPSKEDDCPKDQGGKIRLSYCYTCEESDCNAGRRSVDASTWTVAAGFFVGFLTFAIRKNL